MPDYFGLLTCCLITYGLSFTISQTHGPFGLFEDLRSRIKSKWTSEWVETGLSCPVCVSFWLGMCVSACLDMGVVGWLSSVGFACVAVTLSPE